MIQVGIVWAIVSPVVALFVSDAVHICRSVNRKPPASEPDWLWDQPVDALSDAAVDARFAEIAAHFRVRS